MAGNHRPSPSLGFGRVTRALFLASALAAAAPASGVERLVLTQAPHTPSAAVPADIMDLRYPAGTRVVALEVPHDSRAPRVLSEGLYAAGSPVVSYDAREVVFVGKGDATSPWQVYANGLEGGRWHQLSALPGGAMEPALLGDGDVVFASPVPKTGPGSERLCPSQLYALSLGGGPRRLTFGLGASDPTLLGDGRILFVAPQPSGTSAPPRGTALYTINNDGTEITPFAGQHDPPARLERPRQLTDGRLAFLVASSTSEGGNGTAESVRMARPFQSRAPLLSKEPGAHICSVQPAAGGSAWVCAASPSSVAGRPPHFVVFLIPSGQTNLGPPRFEDPTKDCLEAVEFAPSQRPMGRISTMEPDKHTGQLLCLDINDSTYPVLGGPPSRLTARVRVLAGTDSGPSRVLGEAPVQADGSFMAEVPADTPLGFEALADNGDVLRRLDPMIWVRPGENRSCTGCHGQHNRAPHNHRPLAVSEPVPRLCGEAGVKVTQDMKPY